MVSRSAIDIKYSIVTWSLKICWLIEKACSSWRISAWRVPLEFPSRISLTRLWLYGIVHLTFCSVRRIIQLQWISGLLDASLRRSLIAHLFSLGKMILTSWRKSSRSVARRKWTIGRVWQSFPCTSSTWPRWANTSSAHWTNSFLIWTKQDLTFSNKCLDVTQRIALQPGRLCSTHTWTMYPRR